MKLPKLNKKCKGLSVNVHIFCLQRLGRADSIKEFVRKGTDKAHLELIVSGGPDASDYRICRTLHSEGNKSTFKINGMLVSLPTSRHACVPVAYT